MQLAHLFTPRQHGSPYLAGGLAYQLTSQRTVCQPTAQRSGTAVGGELGYRVTAGHTFAIRWNARYRRWFQDCSDLSEVGFAFGLGGVIH